MATLTKRNKTWRAEVRKHGIRKSATFDTKAQAKAWTIQIEAEIIKNGGSKAISTNNVLKDALQRYKKEVTSTKRGAKQEDLRISFLLAHIPFIDKPLNKITPQDVANWRDFRLQTITGSTVNRELANLSHMFEVARKEWHWCNHNPIKEIRKPPNSKPRDRRITQTEISQILHVLKYQENQPPTKKIQEVAYAFLIALETAMRRGEILGLELQDINLKAKYLTLHITKNNDPRNVPLSNKAIELLSILINKAKQANKLKIFTITAMQLNNFFVRYRNKTDIKGLHFHDTRHEAITRLAQKLDVLDLARMTGHRNINQLRTYYNATPTEIANRLNG